MRLSTCILQRLSGLVSHIKLLAGRENLGNGGCSLLDERRRKADGASDGRDHGALQPEGYSENLLVGKLKEYSPQLMLCHLRGARLASRLSDQLQEPSQRSNLHPP